ncbi:hypothetical protein LJR164_004266 [Phenylobacterium sp. LjRoot164]
MRGDYDHGQYVGRWSGAAVRWARGKPLTIEGTPQGAPLSLD